MPLLALIWAAEIRRPIARGCPTDLSRLPEDTPLPLRRARLPPADQSQTTVGESNSKDGVVELGELRVFDLKGRDVQLLGGMSNLFDA